MEVLFRGAPGFPWDLLNFEIRIVTRSKVVQCCTLSFLVSYLQKTISDYISFLGRLLKNRVLGVGEFRVIWVIVHASRD